MSTSRLVRSLVVAAGICVLAGAGPGGRVRGAAARADAEATFRTDASFVLTDVFVTADGKPVTDLTQADFEVREDGVVQTIRSFEAVRHDAASGRRPAAPQSVDVAESEAMAADPRRRVFVVFLDTFHVDAGAMRCGPQGAAGLLQDGARPRRSRRLHDPAHVGRATSASRPRPIRCSPISTPTRCGASPTKRPAPKPTRSRSELQSCFVGNDAAWLALRSRLREQKSIEALRGLVAVPRRPARVAQGGDRGDDGLAAVPRERDADDRQGHGRPDRRRRAGRRSARTGVLGRRRSRPRRRRQRRGPATTHACRRSMADSQQAVPGPDRRSEPVEHQLLHAGCDGSAHRDGRPHTATPLAGRRRGAQSRARAVLDAARFDPHARRIDQRHGHRRQQRLRAAACAAPPPTSTRTTCSATRRPTARRTASTGRSR